MFSKNFGPGGGGKAPLGPHVAPLLVHLFLSLAIHPFLSLAAQKLATKTNQNHQN